MQNLGDWNRRKIIDEGVNVLGQYSGQITVRQLYYRLVAKGLPNSLNSYKRVVDATTDARWKGEMGFDAFIDRDRSVYGETKAEPTDVDDAIDTAKNQIEAWMTHYRKNKWENQPEYIEVWIEKKALQGVFEMPCMLRSVGLFPCKGYPSLTALYEAHERFEEAEGRGQKPTILYFGDHDPSGDDIPRSLKENMARMGVDVEVERIALTRDQVVSMGLPPAPTKASDSRSRNWSGMGQVELDAVDPHELTQMVEKAIDAHFDNKLYDELKDKERDERDQYQQALKAYVAGL